MRESYSKEIANHADLESCEGICEDALEALTGGNAGRVIEPRNQDKLREADVVMVGGRPHEKACYRQEPTRSRAVGEPRHAWTLSARKPGDPLVTWARESEPRHHREPLRG